MSCAGIINDTAILVIRQDDEKAVKDFDQAINQIEFFSICRFCTSYNFRKLNRNNCIIHNEPEDNIIEVRQIFDCIV